MKDNYTTLPYIVMLKRTSTIVNIGNDYVVRFVQTEYLTVVRLSCADVITKF